MLIKVAYFKGVRKDSTYNMVTFDTENKTLNNWDNGYTGKAAIVEAQMSRDVDALRNRLIEEGYRDITVPAS